MTSLGKGLSRLEFLFVHLLLIIMVLPCNFVFMCIITFLVSTERLNVLEGGSCALISQIDVIVLPALATV